MARRFRNHDEEVQWRHRMDEMQYWRERGYGPSIRTNRRAEEDYRPTFGGENFGGEGGPVDWLHPGGVARFAGRGPLNYKRSDERIVEEVNERLTRHPMIDASHIEVTVRDGEVTLCGTVQDHPMKRMAENAALSVWGVLDVHNEIRLERKRQSAGVEAA